MIKQHIQKLAQSNPALSNLYVQLGNCYWWLHYRIEGMSGAAPLLIHQMGKVGSSSIYDTLKAMNLKRPVYHIHFTSPENLAMIRDSHQRRLQAGILEIDHTQILAPYLKQRIASAHHAGWQVITLVRDPVARNVSTLFQNAHRWIPDFEARCQAGSITSEEMIDVFFSRENFHQQTLEWLDMEIEPLYNINVYKTPFPWTQGYDIYESERAQLMLIRLENLDSLGQTIANFVGLPDLTFKRSNVANEKYYADLYQQFRRILKLPEAYIDEMYRSRFAQHFYSPAEIENFRQMWQS